MKILDYIFVAALGFTSSLTQDDRRKPPSITNNPTTGVIFRENDEVTLTCKAEGIPAVTYAWKRNGEELNLNHTNIRRGSDGDITIVRATRSDDGFYQCFVTNQYGTALSTMARIQMAFLDRRSQSNIVSMTVPEGLPFVIQAPQRNSFPTPTHNWEITTSTIDTNPRTYGQSQRVRSANNGDLHFAYALKEDELGGSIYKNTAFNPNIDVRSGGTYTRVIVTQGSGDPPDFPPNITYFSKSPEVAVIGGSIELECFFSGKPLPEITWSGPRNNLPSGRSSISQHETRLMISNLVESDEGDYVCIANNTLGTFNNTFNIRVEAKPVFKKEYDGPRNVNVTEGESVTFNCSAFANPEATVVWLRNGQPIDVNNASQRFAFSNDNKSLTISDVCRDCVNKDRETDLMVIQCKASNVHGYAFASGYLNVLLKTKVMIRGSINVTVDFLKKKELVSQCYVTSDPSTPPTLAWYKTEPFHDLVRDEPPYVYVAKEFLIIMIDPKCSAGNCSKYLGEYRCIGDNGCSQGNGTIILSYQYRLPPVNKPPERFVFCNDNESLTLRDVCRNCVNQERQTDLMVIQCNASNVHGYNFAQGYLNVSTPPTCEGATCVPWCVVLVSVPSIIALLLLIPIIDGLWHKWLNKNRVVISQDPTVYMNTSVSLNESVPDGNIKLQPKGSTNEPLATDTTSASLHF